MALLAVAAYFLCSDSKESSGGEVNPKVEELDETPDEALTVTLKDFDADSIYVLPKNGHQTVAYAYRDAEGNGQIKGSIQKNTYYSLFPDNKAKKVVILINIEELCREQWFYDQQQHRGIEFNGKGGMASINGEDICFREWKLLNGKLYIYYVRMQQHADKRQKYEVEEAEIEQLNRDRLVLKFLGKTYDCRKASDKPLMLNAR